MTENVCGYAGSDTIFCDGAFLTRHLDMVGSGRIRAESYRVFQTWVLGHEIAHADLRHQVGHFLMAPRPKTQKEAKGMHKTEYEADARFVELAEHSGLLATPERAELARVLVGLFDRAYLVKYGSPSQPGKGLSLDRSDEQVLFPYALADSHPHMTIRAARLLSIVAGPSAQLDDARWFLRQSGAPTLIEELIEADGGAP